MFSANRFQRRITTIDDNDFNRVKQKLEQLLELSKHHQGGCPGSVGYPQNIDILSNELRESSIEFL